MENQYRTAVFLKSAASWGDLSEDKGREVAFVGCSNVGKSTTLNALTDNGKLARASKTPGRTQCINLFELKDPRCRLVDLPGHGYADVPEALRVQWQRFIDQYLRERCCLVGVVLVMDIRTPLKLFEKQMIQWAVSRELPIQIVLNKMDKLSKSAAKSTKLRIEKALEQYEDKVSIQLFSAAEKQGVDELRSVLDAWFGF